MLPRHSTRKLQGKFRCDYTTPGEGEAVAQARLVPIEGMQAFNGLVLGIFRTGIFLVISVLSDGATFFSVTFLRFCR